MSLWASPSTVQDGGTWELLAKSLLSKLLRAVPGSSENVLGSGGQARCSVSGPAALGESPNYVPCSAPALSHFRYLKNADDAIYPSDQCAHLN